MAEITGVYIDYENKITTLMVPHKKLYHGMSFYYIGRLPAGDYAIHKTEDGRGYGGSDVGILLDDCTIDVVKGPYSCAGCFDFGTMAEVVGIPDIGNKAYRLQIGKNLGSYSEKTKQVVFEETEFICGDWEQRIRPEWKGLTIAIHTRNGILFRQCDDIIAQQVL